MARLSHPNIVTLFDFGLAESGPYLVFELLRGQPLDKRLRHGPLPFDSVLAIADVLQREFGDDKYRAPVLLRNYVAAGWLGRKTGRGFYDYG